jgi:hypothetical protein
LPRALADLGEDGVGEDVVAAAGQRPYRLRSARHARPSGPGRRCAWKNGWVSTWSTAGTISLWLARSTSRSGKV